MAIPKVEKQEIQKALEVFDQTLRNGAEWADWEKSKAQVWVIDEDKKLYPPKKIISLATGMSVNDFSGGPETNSYLAERSITVRRLREQKLDHTFQAILERYHDARANQAFAGNHEIKELFGEARRILEESEIVRDFPHVRVVSSYGKGNWATIPWISFLDKRETETTQDGTYVVYLFREDGKGLYVKLAQGVTAPQKALGAKAADVLEERAAKIRSQCSVLASAGFDLSGKTNLGADQKLAKLYEASTIAAKFYPADAIPDQDQLLTDLQALLASYDQYVQGRSADMKPIQDTRPIALLGTWRTVVQDAKEIQSGIDAHGEWATWASFPIRNDALGRLAKPFHLYAYIGKGNIGACLTVADFVTSKGGAGITSPWPAITDDEFRNKTRASEKGAEIFKTWFKVTGIEVLTPPVPVAHFDIAAGLSSESNLLNQSSFGYIFDDEVPMIEPPLSPPAILPPELPIEWLVDKTGLGRDVLEEMVSALTSSSSQIMLAGPPGTSKTWVARLLAQYVTRDRNTNTRFVQFHPSYSYESFIEGLRPVSKDNGISFEVTPGVVLDQVAQMRRDGALNQDGNEYVIIIDEANRANLPKVLGELMFLFEYRNETVQLQYSHQFQLPKNLRFIATMNTADRSIRSIDVALRRRFDVFELQPSAEILEKHYQGRTSITGLVAGFNALNEALTQLLDRHHTIGHTFFMRDQMDAKTLRHIWERRVYPLIEEFFFDQTDIAREFSLERFWPSVNG